MPTRGFFPYVPIVVVSDPTGPHATHANAAINGTAATFTIRTRPHLPMLPRSAFDLFYFDAVTTFCE
jgi:hypothetical protein